MGSTKFLKEVGRTTAIKNIRDLEVFRLVVESGSFTEAAYAAGMSQPAVSQVIERLESSLGAKLLKREQFDADGPLSLTPAGEALLHRATSILDQVNMIPDEVAAAERPREYRIGLPPIIASYLFGPSLDLLVGSLQGGVSIQGSGSSKLLQDMEHHRSDFGGIATLDTQLQIEGVETFKIASFPFGIVSASHGVTDPFNGRDNTDVADVADMNFVTLNEDFVHFKVFEKFIHPRIAPNRIIQVASIDVMKSLIASGFAVGLMVSVVVEDDSRLRFLPIHGVELPTFDIYLFRDTNARQPMKREGERTFLNLAGRHHDLPELWDR